MSKDVALDLSEAGVLLAGRQEREREELGMSQG